MRIAAIVGTGIGLVGLLFGCGAGVGIGAAGSPSPTVTVRETVTTNAKAIVRVGPTVTIRVTRTVKPRHRAAPPVSAPQPRTDPHFGTCGEANDAGYGPYREGVDPEYDWYTDRDHDGVVCER